LLLDGRELALEFLPKRAPLLLFGAERHDEVVDCTQHTAERMPLDVHLQLYVVVAELEARQSVEGRRYSGTNVLLLRLGQDAIRHEEPPPLCPAAARALVAAT
jgi:hypothetical protein